MNRSSYPRLLAGAVCSLLSYSLVHADETPLAEVFITASLGKNPLEVAQPTIVLSGDDLSRKIASSLGETLSQQLGVSSSYFGPTASRPVIRGLGSYRVQTLQDGISSLDVASISDDHAVTIDSALAEQLEVLKGPATLLYGSGASGGLINVVTHRIPDKVPENGISGLGEVRYGSVSDEKSGAASFTAGSKTSQNNGFAVHGDYFSSKSGPFAFPSFNISQRLQQQLIDAGEPIEGYDKSIPNSRSEAKGGSLGASWLGEDATIGASGSRYQTTYGIPAEAAAFIDMKQNRFDTNAELRLSDSWLRSVQLRAAYNDYTHTEFESPGITGTLFTQKAYEARLAFNHALNDWHGTFGAQVTQLDFKAEGEEALVPTSLTKDLGLFALEERELGAWLFNFGVRAEHQTIDVGKDIGTSSTSPRYNDTAYSFAGGAILKLTTDDSLALNLTRTARHPQATELYANGPHGAAQRFEIGDASLQTEIAHTVDLSLRRQSDSFSWMLTTFYNSYQHFTYAAPTGEIENDLPKVVYRQSAATLYGYEAELWTPLITNVNGSTLRLRLMTDSVRGKQAGGDALPQIPPMRFGAGLHFDKAVWHAELEALYNNKQNKVANNELPTDGFTMLNADMSYRIESHSGDWLLFVRGTNLLDEEARQHSSSLKDRVPLPGRSLSAGVRVTF